MELENIILSEVTQSHKRTHMVCTYLLAQKFGMSKNQFRDYMKPKQKEDQNVDASVLLRRVKKIHNGGNMKAKCGAEIEANAIH